MASAPRQLASPISGSACPYRPVPGIDAVSRLLFVASLFSLGIMIGYVPAAGLPKMPDDLRTAKIDYGKADFGKKVFDEYPDLGLITDLHYGHFNNDMEPELALVGTAGAIFVGPDHRVKKTIHFAARMFNPVVLIQPKGGGAPVFLDRGGGWMEKVRLFDENGALRWDYGILWGIDGSAAGDVDGDGKLEFAVGLNAWGGIRLLNADGHELWSKRAGNVWHVETTNAEDGAVGEIIHSDARGALTFRNGKGDVLLTCRPTRYVHWFGLTRWANEPQPRHLLIPDKDVIVVLDLNGQQTLKLEAPGCAARALCSIISAPVCFSSRRCYQATLVDYPQWDRSVLYLNDQSGKVAYREVFEHRCAAVGTMPAAPGAKDESLLVGCSSEVWKYANLH